MCVRRNSKKGEGVIHMEENRRELINIINSISNPKLLDYLTKFIKEFIRLRQ